jgi:hypothetical protein
MAAKRTLTAMDLVTRSWARQLGLDECGVMVLILLGHRESLPACELAVQTGRARQQVQRSLQLMEKLSLVCPAELSRHGRTVAWMLTELGLEYWRALEPVLYEWDLSWLSSSMCSSSRGCSSVRLRSWSTGAQPTGGDARSFSQPVSASSRSSRGWSWPWLSESVRSNKIHEQFVFESEGGLAPGSASREEVVEGFAVVLIARMPLASGFLHSLSEAMAAWALNDWSPSDRGRDARGLPESSRAAHPQPCLPSKANVDLLAPE